LRRVREAAGFALLGALVAGAFLGWTGEPHDTLHSYGAAGGLFAYPLFAWLLR
jgi:hypothetical protein